MRRLERSSNAPVVESVDAPDSKSGSRERVGVQVPPGAPKSDRGSPSHESRETRNSLPNSDVPIFGQGVAPFEGVVGGGDDRREAGHA